MLHTSAHFPLSKANKDELTRLGATIKSGDIYLCNLHTPQARDWFLRQVELLHSAPDPFVGPTFGYPGTVPDALQIEVLNVISSYQSLRVDDFAHGNLPPIHTMVNLPSGLKWHFQYAPLALVGVVKRIANPGPGTHTDLIDRLPVGAFVCDLIIIYANVFFILHINRSH